MVKPLRFEVTLEVTADAAGGRHNAPLTQDDLEHYAAKAISSWAKNLPHTQIEYDEAVNVLLKITNVHWRPEDAP